jgi:Fe-S-cluster containining protein
MSNLSEELQALYAQVPATRCEQSGECCVLTDAEFDDEYATMFPLYAAEYLNIVAYAKEHFPPSHSDALLAFTEERPRRCPFLGSENDCTIYPVRPLICRTYAVMKLETISAAATRSKGTVPEDWIHGFILRESGMICPRVTVVEPEKLEQHAENIIHSRYERELTRLSREAELGNSDRWRIFRKVSGAKDWPLRWTWGGFNAICTSSMEWIRGQFKSYWKRASLAEGI